MHKIKEMLHRDDSEDSTSKNTNTSKDIKHEEHKERKQTDSTLREEHVHKHETVQAHGDKHMHSGEKHVYHEREVLQDGGNLYKQGVDPTLDREIVQETRHDGGVSRAVVGEAEIIREKIKEVELHKVQPVIHRDREQKEIRHIVEPHQQFEVKDTQIAHRERDIDLGTRREESSMETSRAIGGAPQMESSREFLGTERQHQELPTQLEEHVHRKIEEHVHPVIYKETLKPKVTEEVHHIYETVKEMPVETYEVKEVMVHGSGSTRDAERAFFEEHSNRAINIDNSSSRSIQKEEKKAKKHKHAKHTHEHTHEVVQTSSAPMNAQTVSQEPFTGHHQNIGAHHLPSSVISGGHNTAYDAALAQSTQGQGMHSEKDTALMQKMNEKQVAKEEKLEEKQDKKAAKDSKSSDVV